MSIQQAYESYGNNLIGAGGGGGSFSQIQSDWNVSDNTRVDYIKNKPTIPSDADDLDYSNTSSELSATKVQGAIDELAKPTFTEAGTRANIASGEKLSTIFGKIKKFFTDLKTVAFTGAYSDLSGKPSLATVATSGSYSDLSGKPNLATVATSGSYNDLSNKPTIPTNNNQLTNGAGYITSAGSCATAKGIVPPANNQPSYLGTMHHFRNVDNTAYSPIYASAFNQSSSRLVKENIKPVTEEDAKKILNLNVVGFDYKDVMGGKKDQIGMIAEEVLDVFPNLITVPNNYDEKETIENLKNGELAQVLSIDYAKFVPLLIKMIQMQQKELQNIKENMDNKE